MNSKYKSAIIFTLCLTLVGCATVKDKFTRKKKQEEKIAPVIEIQDYASTVEVDELYKKHFTFWKYWQQDLIQYLGGNSKRQRRSYNEAVVELKTLSSYLQEQKRKELEPYIRELQGFREDIYEPYLSEVEIHRLKVRLGKHKRAVDRQFSFSEMKPWLIKDPREQK